MSGVRRASVISWHQLTRPVIVRHRLARSVTIPHGKNICGKKIRQNVIYFFAPDFFAMVAFGPARGWSLSGEFPQSTRTLRLAVEARRDRRRLIR